MSNFNILIVEDEELYADKLEMLVDRMGYAHLGTVNNATAALEIINRSKPDLILMDIYITGEYDGIELTDLIHQRWHIPVIFITSLTDELTYRRAARTRPVRFLPKSFDVIQLQRTIELSLQQLAATTRQTDSEQAEVWKKDVLFDEYIFIKVRHRLEKIVVNEIVYLAADGHYCQVHTATQKYLVRISLLELKQRLSAVVFFQTHRSFLVNLKKITSVDLQDSVVFLNEHQVPISKRRREAFMKQVDWL